MYTSHFECKVKKVFNVHQRQSLSVTFCCATVWKDWWDSSWLQYLLWPNVAEMFIAKVFRTNHRILCQSQPVILAICHTLANHCHQRFSSFGKLHYKKLKLKHTVHATFTVITGHKQLWHL